MSLFSKAHYVWLASVTRDQIAQVKSSRFSTPEQLYGVFVGIEVLTKALEAENDNFDREMFLRNIFENPLAAKAKL